ncbi:hypothetical protein HBB16_02545 [Pseudonocardia sp. MCCB 268]|nr:hypothetical protein [Pseudonocardia cytotoxica]
MARADRSRRAATALTSTRRWPGTGSLPCAGTWTRSAAHRSEWPFLTTTTCSPSACRSTTPCPGRPDAGRPRLPARAHDAALTDHRRARHRGRDRGIDPAGRGSSRRGIVATSVPPTDTFTALALGDTRTAVADALPQDTHRRHQHPSAARQLV